VCVVDNENEFYKYGKDTLKNGIFNVPKSLLLDLFD